MYVLLTMIFFEVFDYSILFLSILPVTLASAWTGSKNGTFTGSTVVAYNIFIIYFTGHTGIVLEATFIGTSAVTILLAWMVGKIKDINTELNMELKRRKRIENRLSRSKKRVKKLHDIATELESCRQKEEIYTLTIQAAKDILAFDRCEILVIQNDELIIEETSSPLTDNDQRTLPLHDSIAGKTYLKNESFVFEDVEYPSSNDSEETEKYSIVVTLPIGDEAIFQARCKDGEFIDDEDFEVLELLCDHSAEALKRLDMLEREEFLHSLLRHDVKNKINIVKRYMHMIKDHDLPEEAEEYFDRAEKVVQKSDDLTEKIKTLSRMEQEKITDVDAAEALRSAINRNKSLTSEQCIYIERDLNKCLVKAGPLLEELFSNLIENCLKHSDGEMISISIEEDKYKAKVIIEDDGVGISKQEKEKIFQKGYKKGENAGSGLGMYIVNEIAKNYGTKVKVSDSDLGGARFEVSLEKNSE